MTCGNYLFLLFFRTVGFHWSTNEATTGDDQIVLDVLSAHRGA